MKFDELKLTCEVVEPKDFNEDLNTPIPASTPLYSTRGEVECKGKCGFWPFKVEWLSPSGYCNVCENKRRRREDAEAAFSGMTLNRGMCMRCGEEYFNLPKEGYCNQCFIIINELGMKAARVMPLSSEKETTRTLNRIPQNTLPAAPRLTNGLGYFCYKCEKYKARMMGSACLDCQANCAGPTLFHRCGSCYQMRATVLGAVCAVCRKNLIEAGLGRPPAARFDALMKYTKLEEGGWEEEKIILTLPECQKHSTPLNPGDARLGAVEEV